MRRPALLLALAITGCTAAAQAPSGRRDVARCDAPTDCRVIPRTCCGVCGAAVPGDARAVSDRWLEERQARGERICEGTTGCPDCYARTSPTLVATCRNRRCALVDLGASPITACRSHDDCALTFAGCCECGSAGAIAVRRGREDDYRRLVCGDGPVTCPQCVGRPLGGAARCVSGRCVADDLL